MRSLGSLSLLLLLTANFSPLIGGEPPRVQSRRPQVVAIPIKNTKEGAAIRKKLESFGLTSMKTSETLGYGGFLFYVPSNAKDGWLEFLTEQGINIVMPQIAPVSIKEFEIAVSLKNSSEGDKTRDRLEEFGFTATKTSTVDDYSGYVFRLPRDNKGNSIKIFEMIGHINALPKWTAAACGTDCAQVAGDFYLAGSEVPSAGHAIDDVYRFLCDYYGGKAGPPRIQLLGKDAEQVKLEVDKLSQEVIKHKKYWEKLRLQVIFAKGEKQARVFVNVDGWYAPAGGTGDVSSTGYDDMEKNYLNEFKTYVESLTASINEKLRGK